MNKWNIWLASHKKHGHHVCAMQLKELPSLCSTIGTNWAWSAHASPVQIKEINMFKKQLNIKQQIELVSKLNKLLTSKWLLNLSRILNLTMRRWCKCLLVIFTLTKRDAHSIRTTLIRSIQLTKPVYKPTDLQFRNMLQTLLMAPRRYVSKIYVRHLMKFINDCLMLKYFLWWKNWPWCLPTTLPIHHANWADQHYELKVYDTIQQWCQSNLMMPVSLIEPSDSLEMLDGQLWVLNPMIKPRKTTRNVYIWALNASWMNCTNTMVVITIPLRVYIQHVPRLKFMVVLPALLHCPIWIFIFKWATTTVDNSAKLFNEMVELFWNK